MTDRRTYLLRCLLCVFIALFISTHSSAQKSIGIEWNSPNDLREFERDLEFFKDHKVSFLVLNHPLNQEKIEYLDRFGIPYLIRLDNKFITRNQFKADSVSLVSSIKNNAALYDSSSTFSGVIGFSDSDIEPISLNTEFSVYFESHGILESVSTLNLAKEKAVFFRPNHTDAKSIHTFQKVLSDNQVLILDSDWLKSVVEKFPSLEITFSSDSEIDPELIPLPELPNQLPIIHWSIVVLLLLWISLGVNVGTNLTYLETIPRYFTAHRFFVDDIMSYRERSSKSALFLLFQHAIFGGLVLYILAKIFVSTVGLEALYYHLPYLGVMGQNYFSLFVITSVIVFFVELIALIWLYLPNKEMTHFNQPLNLFTWIFHLDFIVVTLIVTAYFADLNPTIISILAICYLLIWFSSFNITALDASKRLGLTRNAYLFKTIGLHTLASGSIVALLLIFSGWWGLVRLVVSV
tara:strand:- start:49 stop:1440 length:1392 start_codon:yes stop_codon:yes gene_type:complete